jgi:signal transduction histidine kinase
MGVACASWYPADWSALSADDATLSTEQKLQAVEKLHWHDPDLVWKWIGEPVMPERAPSALDLHRRMITLLAQSIRDGMDVTLAELDALEAVCNPLENGEFWRARLQMLRGDLHFRRGNPLQALKSYENAARSFKILGQQEWTFLAMLRSGRLRALLGEDLAVVEMMAALIERSANYPQIQASARLVKAISLKRVGRPGYETERSLGREVLLMSGDPVLYSLVLVSDFDFVMLEEDWILAEELVLETRMFARIHGMKWLQARKFGLRAKLDLVYNQLESSSANLEQALQLLRESGWSGWQGLMQISYAQNALNFSLAELAKEKFLQALPLNTVEMSLIIEPEVYGGLSQVAELQGDFLAAYEAHRRYKKAADKRLDYIVQQHYQMREQQVHSELMQLEAALEENQIRQTRRIRNLIIIVMLLLMITVVLLAIRLRLAAIANAHLEKAVANEKKALENANKAREAAEQANIMKSEFISNISHEVRTPLNAVIGMASLLEELNLSPQQQQCVDTIKVCGDHLMRLISDILDLGSIEAGRLELRESSFALRDVVRHCTMMLESKAQKKSLPIEVQYSKDLPEMLMGDELRLGQVLLNLLDNALKFTAKGKVILRIAKAQQAEGKSQLLFEVEDTGIGIPQDQRERIFEPFTQVDSSVTRSHTGAGLGLTISRRLVQLMGGQIKVQSEPGKGTIFQVKIPL